MVGPRPDRLTVLYVSEAYTPHDRRFLAALVARDVAVAWLPLRALDDGDAVPLPSSAVRRFDAGSGEAVEPGGSLEAARVAIARVAREAGADVVHAGPAPTAGLAAVRARVAPVVVSSWGSDVLLAADGPAETRERVEEALRQAGGFLADAACVVAAAEGLGLPPSTPRAVFPWGVEADRRAPPASGSALREGLGWADARVCVATRAWTLRYRVDVLVEAFDRAAARDPGLRLLLLGGGEESALVRATLAGRIAEGGVVCPGRVSPDSVRSFLEAADLYVSTVPSDGSSVSLLEAMAAARAPVVVDAPGNREWVEPGRSGWLVPDGDPVATADALLEAFSDPARLREFGARSRETVLARANWEENFSALLDLYAAVAR